jgi:hypothetical protein
MNKETVEEAWKQFKKPWSFREDGEWSAKQFFEAGWKANSAKWTDEEVKSLTDYVARYSWGHYDPIATIKKWWEQYKQQIK